MARGGQNSDRQYPQKLIAAGALNSFDIFNYHTYSKKDDITTAFNQIKTAVGDKPIWITEIGYPSDSIQQENTRTGYPYPSGEDGQAAYMADILPHVLGLGVEKVFWYTLVDVPRDDTDFCTYGVVYVSGKQCVGGEQRDIGGTVSAKKAFDAYKDLTLSK